MNTPFQWAKQIASHYGGTRNGMVISWPARIKDKGGIRPQWHHVIDIVPTILEACGIEQPSSVNGVAQKPIEGVSMAYTFDDPKAPSARHTQYFRDVRQPRHLSRRLDGLHHPAVRRPGRTRPSSRPVDVVSGYKWELYNVAEDFSEAVNLADKNPDKLHELQLLFYAEAAKYNVLPLDDSRSERLEPGDPSQPHARADRVHLHGALTRIPEGAAPDMKNKSFRITADVVLTKGNEQGVLVTQGGLSAAMR